MKYKNFFTALFPSLVDADGYYQMQKEMNFKAVENTMFNVFAGKETFRAIVLPESIDTTSNSIAFNREKSLRVRPLDLHDFILPEPCTGKNIQEIKKIIAMHPIAYPDNTIPKGGDNETADSGIMSGQIVECYFESGPDSGGSMRGLRYRLTKQVATNLIDLGCLGSTDLSTLFGGGNYTAGTYGAPQRRLYKGKMGSAIVANGQLPGNILGATNQGIKVMIDVVEDVNKLEKAFKENFKKDMKYSGYRSYDGQVRVYEDPEKIMEDGKHLGALPGTSNHGWGLAIDINTKDNNGVKGFEGKVYKWLKKNAGTYNFFHPDWAQENGSNPEPWHWEWSKKNQVLSKAK
jgi:hypothetical protein